MRIKKIVVATGNVDKMREIREILKDFCDKIVSIKDEGLKVDIDENAETFEGNALIKARAVWEQTGEVVIADDSGLVVDALNGEPGVHSARFMGENASYHDKNMRIIKRLEGVKDEDRTARFVCCAAVIFPDGSEKTVRGVMEGRIGYEEKGKNGFGYDPIFFLPEYGKTSAQIEPEEKNAISHRGQAFRAVRAEIEAYADPDSK